MSACLRSAAIDIVNLLSGGLRPFVQPRLNTRLGFSTPPSISPIAIELSAPGDVNRIELDRSIRPAEGWAGLACRRDASAWPTASAGMSSSAVSSGRSKNRGLPAPRPYGATPQGFPAKSCRSRQTARRGCGAMPRHGRSSPASGPVAGQRPDIGALAAIGLEYRHDHDPACPPRRAGQSPPGGGRATVSALAGQVIGPLALDLDGGKARAESA